jgi:hypothetical protein
MGKRELTKAVLGLPVTPPPAKVSFPETRIGDMRVWWIPQVPMKAFHVPVKSVDEAKLILATLAKYDLFQLENKIKPDFCNAGGLEVYEILDDNVEWCEWSNKDGDSIDDVMKAERGQG